MLQIGIRAHDMEKASIEKMVESMAGKGLKCTQLALSKAISDFNTDIGAMTPGMAMYLKRIFESNKVDIAVLGCYQELGNGDKEVFKDILRIYKAHIRFAKTLGCGMVGTETWSSNLSMSDDKSLEILIENMKEIVAYAESMGVIIGMEPVAGHIVYDIKRAREVLDAVGSPNLQIIFDPVNLITYDNYQSQEQIINEAFELLGDDIACIHAKDFVVEKDKTIKSVISGDGLLNYQLLLTKLKKKKPFIHILLEETTPANLLYAKEYIEEIYEKC